jgi:hypothetical protein
MACHCLHRPSPTLLRSAPAAAARLRRVVSGACAFQRASIRVRSTRPATHAFSHFRQSATLSDMTRRPSLVASALARIERGPSYVRFVPELSQYNIGILGLHHDDGVWLSIHPKTHAVTDYESAELRLQGETYRLPRRTADDCARIVARAMRRRAVPLAWPAVRRRKSAARPANGRRRRREASRES